MLQLVNRKSHFVRLCVQILLMLMLIIITYNILATCLQVVVNGDPATILSDTDGPGSLECSVDGGEFQASK